MYLYFYNIRCVYIVLSTLNQHLIILSSQGGDFHDRYKPSMKLELLAIKAYTPKLHLYTRKYLFRISYGGQSENDHKAYTYLAEICFYLIKNILF